MDPITLGIAGIGGLFNWFGQSSANEANLEATRETNRTNKQLAADNQAWMTHERFGAQQFNMHEAKKNRDWQQQMSSTAHQREVEDLKAAGLNPILSAGGGASTPGGANASISQNSSTAPRMEAPRVDTDMVGRAIATALQAATTIQDMDNKKAQAEATRASMRNTEADTAVKLIDGKVRLEEKGAAISRDKTDAAYKKEALKQLEYGAGAAAAKARLDKKTAEIDYDAAGFDAVLDRVDKAVGTAGSAMRNLIRGKSTPNTRRRLP